MFSSNDGLIWCVNNSSRERHAWHMVLADLGLDHRVNFGPLSVVLELSFFPRFSLATCEFNVWLSMFICVFVVEW